MNAEDCMLELKLRPPQKPTASDQNYTRGGETLSGRMAFLGKENKDYRRSVACIEGVSGCG